MPTPSRDLSSRDIPTRLAALALFFAIGAQPTVCQEATESDAAATTTSKELRTPCEAAAFKEYTSYKDMVDYMQSVQATTTEMKMGFYGETWEGRRLPYAIFSRPTITQPWEALVSGKPIVLCHANVHGGERTLRESVLIFLRELAKKGSPANALLDDLVILVAPQINPDGFEASPRGTRGNSWGIDMNRDYMKLEQKAIVSLVQNLHNSWHPHIIIDGHNGGARPYDLCYQANSNASPSQSISDICDRALFPYINKRMADNGFKSFYYSGGNKEQWRTGGSDPRISRNYSGFINSIGILFESPHGFSTLETGVKAGIVGYRAVLEFAAKNPDKVMNLVNKARRETIAMGEKPEGEVMVQMRSGPEDFKVDYELRDGTKVTGGLIIKKPIVTKARKRAYAYILPRDARDAVAMLRRHGITVEVLQEATRIPVESYQLKDVQYMRKYNHSAAVRVEVGEVLKSEQRFPAGTFVVTTAQMHGRLVAHLLEPETNDNVVRWNTMDSLLPKTRVGAAANANSVANAGRGGRRGNRNAGGGAGAGNQGRGAGGRAAGGQGTGGQGRGAGGRAAGGRGAGGLGAGGQGRERWGGGAGARRGNRGIGRRRPQGPPVIPIYKLIQPMPLSTRILQ